MLTEFLTYRDAYYYSKLLHVIPVNLYMTNNYIFLFKKKINNMSRKNVSEYIILSHTISLLHIARCIKYAHLLSRRKLRGMTISNTIFFPC